MAARAHVDREPVAEGQRVLRRVLRPFEGEGVTYHAGQVVDVTSWRNAQRLVDQHRLSEYVVKE